MSTYSLPLLQRQEIISILTQDQIINVTDSDLTNPTPNFVCNLYTSLLLRLNVLQDDPSQVEFAALDRFDNPDIHSDAVRIMNLFVKIKDVLGTIECPIPFTLNDLICPEANRNSKFLSAILNYLLHRQSKLSMLSSYGEQLDALEEQRMQKESRISQLLEQIAAIREMRESEKPLILEGEARLNELKQSIDNLNSLQLKLKKDRIAMKEKANELTENVNKAEYELIQATGDNAHLRSKIVQSPDKLQSALEEKKALELKAKESERLAFQRYEERTAVLEVYTKAWQKMTKQLAQMQELQEQANTAKSAEKDLKQLKAKFSDDQMLEISLQAKIMECEAKAEQLAKQKHELERQKNVRREEDTRGLNSVKLEAESRRHDLVARRKNIEAIVAEADSIKAKVNSIKELAAATQLELLKKSDEITNELNLYSSSMEQAISKVGAPAK